MKFDRGQDGAYLIDREDGAGFQPVEASEFGREQEQRKMVDDMGGIDTFLTGAGKTFTDWGRGAKNLYARATDDGQMLDEAQASQREHNAEYQPMQDYGGLTARAGELAPAVATGALGGMGLGGIATQMGIGTGLGMVENPDDMVSGGLWGAGLTAGGIGLGAAANRVVTSLGRAGSAIRANNTQADALMRGEQAGLQFTPGQKSQNRADILLEEKLRRTPAYAGIDAERIAGNQSRLNQLAARTLGIENADSIDPTMLGKTADDVGSVFDAIANQGEDIILDGGRLNSLAADLSEPAESLFNRMRAKHPGIFDNSDTSGAISGTDFNNARNWLSKQLRLKANVQSGAADELGEVMGILDDGLEAANPQLAEEIGAARQKWKALLVVQDSMRGSANAASGDISAPGAFQALRKYDKRGFERGGTQDNDFYNAVRAMAASQDKTPLTGVNPGTFGGGLVENLIKKPLAENYMQGGAPGRVGLGLLESANPEMTDIFRRLGISGLRPGMMEGEQ